MARAGLVQPAYSDVAPWMQRMAEHGCGTALIFARCETRWWFDWVWPFASGMLFLQGRVTFCRGDGTGSKPGHNAGGPSVLVSFGSADWHALAASGLAGALIGPAIVQGP
jgi:hypothetical protein